MQSSDAQIIEMCERLKTLSNKIRLSIVLLFLDGKERTVNEIAESLNIAQSTASEQLKKIKDQSQFIASRKEGKEVYYFPNRAEVIGFAERINNYLKNCC